MTKKEIIEEVARCFLSARSKTAKESAATVALRDIDTNAPFVFAAVDNSTVVCLQPIGRKRTGELNEILDKARRLESAAWYYCHPQDGVSCTTYLTVVASIENYINNRLKKKKP